VNLDKIPAIVGLIVSILQGVDISWRYISARRLNGRGLYVRLAVLCGGVLLVLCCWPQVNGETSEFHYQQAKQFFDSKNRTQAIEEARQAIQIEPANIGSWKLLGACYGIDRNMEDSVAAYERATKIDPDDVEARLGLATALEATGKKSEAVQAYRVVLRHPKATIEQSQLARQRVNSLHSQGAKIQ